MKHVFFIFPHQLYYQSFPIPIQHIYLLEDPLFFGDDVYPILFHKQKIVLHRASMKTYIQWLQKKSYDITYMDYSMLHNNGYHRILIKKHDVVHVYDPTDDILLKRIKKFVQQKEAVLQVHPSPNFITSIEDIHSFFEKKQAYRQTEFYIWQRKKHAILLDQHNKPSGGVWTYDIENRKSLPKLITVPNEYVPKHTPQIQEAITYVHTHFSRYPGNTDRYIFPTTRQDALDSLTYFLSHKLAYFGPYQDAISTDHPFIFHSLISSSLNSGLLSPQDIIDHTLIYAEQHDIPIASVEGFIRQIIGWREFVRSVYICEGVKERTSNYFGYTKKIPKSFWEGTTGIDPVDDVIKKVHTYAYAHHIERLMILGNFMLLCESDPDDVYRWFMTFFIDAYDWVMVPNVYGMSQYADGGLITTKPYISSSHYIRNMSNYAKGPWCTIWDALYWRFIWTHKKLFADNYRMRFPLIALQKMDKTTLSRHRTIADTYLESLGV